MFVSFIIIIIYRSITNENTIKSFMIEFAMTLSMTIDKKDTFEYLTWDLAKPIKIIKEFTKNIY